MSIKLKLAAPQNKSSEESRFLSILTSPKLTHFIQTPSMNENKECRLIFLIDKKIPERYPVAQRNTLIIFLYLYL